MAPPAVRNPSPLSLVTQMTRNQTPSPHRFLSGTRRAKSPVKSSKMPSRLTQSTGVVEEAAATTTPHRQQEASASNPPPSQFAPTPRFSLGRPKPASTQIAPSPPRTNLAQALRPPRPSEDVEETHSPEADSPHDDEEEMLLTTDPDELIQPSIEPRPHLPPPTDLPFSPKRRRLEPTNPPSPLPTSASTNPHPRFAPPSTSTSTPAPAPSTRPSFLRPPTPPQPAPLPQTFSPHRRGAAFVPGGAAATLQSWVVETGQSAMQYSALRSRDDAWGFRVRVEVLEGMEGCGWRVLGRREGGDRDGEVVRCLLVGEGKGSLRVGGVVGVGGLGWRVDVVGEGVWWVGVGWEAG